MLQQRAKLRWLKYGDQCSKVFFRKINARRAQQRVFQITTQSGQLLTDMPQVTAEFVSFFQNLLGGNRRRRDLNLMFLQQGLKHVLTREEGEGLIAAVTMSEVKDAVFDISSDSAPGPDGYTSLFFKAAWPEIGNEICAAVIEFFQSGKLLKQINATLLTLIPKRVLHLLIDYSQNAFVPGRSISDNILLAQELLAGYNQSKLPPRCTIKIDIQKAYDSVEWDFLLEGLRVFNFPPQFIVWINQCVSTATFSVALNGAVYGFFPGARGLRQGDPISLLSGLRVSPMKSQIILSRSCHGERQQILDVMGFQEGTLPIKYLGVPLVSSRLSVADCQPLIQKVDRRLAGWNQLSLSFAGRVQLIKSVLSSLHTYWASVFILPKAVLKVIEERMRSFLWKGASGSGVAKEDKCSIWVSWVLRYRLKNQTLWTAKVSNAPWCWKKLVKLSVLIKPGLPSDSFLYEVLRHGHWMWPSVTDFTVNERLCLAFRTLFRLGILWASRRWRGAHLLNVASRSLLASVVYHLWLERNNRRFKATATSAESVALRAIEDVRLRILSSDIKPSLQAQTL
ncbi:UNVERIFIED_CONTAM: hypothetical protein Sradi_7273900 [Sesamum radiatum]|uniref:Reverse transcriptase domain-containing protein n=1 Tax=Sesamum radiatum TaxID=300843 RepID=A0AAW2IIN3_SESRA